MPAASVSDRFCHFLFAEPAPASVAALLRFVEDLKGVEFKQRDPLLRTAEELFEAAVPAPLTYWLTTQEEDLFGNPRPYNTDPLLDFVFSGPMVDVWPLRRFRLCAVAEIQAYCDILDTLLESPAILEDERDDTVSVGIRLRKVKSGLMLVRFRQGL